MNKIDVFGNMEILTDDLSALQSYKEEDIKTRTTDIFQYGIVNTGVATAPFCITFNPSLPNAVDIGPGIAYNVNGDRVQIYSGESVTADLQVSATIGSDPYVWSNSVHSYDAQTPQQATPYSTGNVQVLIKNGNIGTTNYFFIDFVSTVVDMTITWGDWANKTYIKTSLDQENNLNKYPYKKNGYRIIVDDVNVTLVDGTWTHNNYPNAIYIGSAVCGVGAGDISAIDITTARKYYWQNGNTQAVTTPLTTNQTKSYAQGVQYSVDAHVKAVGDATKIKSNNPHGQTIYDLEYTGQDLAQHRIEQHSSGITSYQATYTLSNLHMYQANNNTVTVRFDVVPGTPALAEGFEVNHNGNRVVRSTIVAANSSLVMATMSFNSSGTWYIQMMIGTNVNGLITTSQTKNTDYYTIGIVSWDGSDVTELVDKRKFGSINYKDLQQGFIPIGAVQQYFGPAVAGTPVTGGWLLMDGSSVGNTGSGATYAGPQYYDLFQHINVNYFGSTKTWGSTFGTVYPTLTVTLPDMRNLFARGASTTLTVGGPSQGSDTTPLSHTHVLTSVTALSGASNYHNHNLYGDLGTAFGSAGEANLNWVGITRDDIGGTTYPNSLAFGNGGGSLNIQMRKAYRWTLTSGEGMHTHELSPATGIESSPANFTAVLTVPKHVGLHFIIKY